MRKRAITLTFLALVILGWSLFLNKRPTTRDLEAKRVWLQKEVEAGKLTQEQADSKLEWLQKTDAKEVLSKGQARIQDAVNQYWQRFENKHPSMKMPAKTPRKQIDPETMRARIQSAVDSGELTREQAEAKLQWLEQAQSKKGQ